MITPEIRVISGEVELQSLLADDALKLGDWVVVRDYPIRNEFLHSVSTRLVDDQGKGELYLFNKISECEMRRAFYIQQVQSKACL